MSPLHGVVPGVGLGWRPAIADLVAHLATQGAVGFAELIAEGLQPGRALPESLTTMRSAGVPVVPHAVSLSLGGVDEPDPSRVAHLAACAEALDAPLVSDHVAFVRATVSGTVVESGHLLPLPRTREALDVLVRNVRLVTPDLPVPLAVEPIAALLDLGGELREAEFLTELVERTGVWLLLDVANVYANGLNHGYDPADVLAALPLERIAYCHVAGGRYVDGRYRDTHLDPTPPAVLDLVRTLVGSRADAGLPPPPLLLERDGDYPVAAELAAEVAGIHAALAPARARVAEVAEIAEIAEVAR